MIKKIIKQNFHYKKIIVLIAVAAMALIFFHLPAKWIFNPDTSVCIHKRIFGIGCPLCGMTRAMFDILHLSFKSAVLENFAVFPFVLLLISAFLFVLYPLKMRKIFFIQLYFTLAIFIIVYVLRLAGLY